MVTCQRSLDGGMIWLPPGGPAFTHLPGILGGVMPGAAGLDSCSGGAGHGIVGPDGIVYLPRLHCGVPMLGISRDEGMTWEQVQVGDAGVPCGQAIEGTTCEHEAGVAMDSNGTLYYLWNADDHLLYLATSRDGGQTWSPRKSVNLPGLVETNLPQAAAGGPGKLAFAYIGTKNSPGAPFTGDYAATTWNAYMAVSHDADSADPTFMTAQLNVDDDPIAAGPCVGLRCGSLYDFIDIRIAPDGTPWAPFVDGCLTACPPGQTDESEAIVGRVWGGESLWDSSDPNGPYP